VWVGGGTALKYKLGLLEQLNHNKASITDLVRYLCKDDRLNNKYMF